MTREYTFGGYIKSLVDKDPRARSGVYAEYVVAGALHYWGKRSDGTRVEIVIAEEPAVDNHVYRVVAGEATDNGDAAEDDGEAEVADDASAPDEKLYAGRHSQIIIVRDNNQLPLPHVGMYVSLVLTRGERLPAHLLVDEQGAPITRVRDTDALAYYQYAYVIKRVKKWRALRELTHHTLVASLSKPVATLANVQRRVERDAHIVSRAWRVNSVSVNAKKKSGAAVRLFELADATWKPVVDELSARPLALTDTLPHMLAACETKSDTIAPLYNAFGPMFALCQNLLTSSGGQAIERPKLEDCVSQLRIGGRVLNAASPADVRTLDRWLADNEPQFVLFFGALDVLPVGVASSSPLLASWPGYEWMRMRDRAITSKLGAYIKTALGDRVDKEADPADIIQLAHRLHTQQQLPWNVGTAIIDLTYIVASIDKFWHVRMGLPPVQPDELQTALLFLASIGAWRPVPESTAMRLAMQTSTGTGVIPQFYCTQREYNETARLAHTVVQMIPQTKLVVVAYTGHVPAQMLAGRWLIVYAGVQPVREHVSKQAVRLSAYSLLSTGGVVDCDQPYCADLAAYDQLALLDAHLLSRDALQFLLGLFQAATLPGTNVLLAGDVAMNTSEFAMLAASGRMHVAPSTSVPPGGPESVSELRSAASAAISAGAHGRQRLIDAVMRVMERSLNKTWLDCWRRGSRFVIVAPYRNDQRRVFKQMASTCTDKVLANGLLELSRDPSLAEHTIFTALPYIGYRGAACLVLRAYVVDRPPGHLDVLQKRHCSLVFQKANPALATLSLDSPHLLLEIFGFDFDQVDHRRCCGTWSATVMSVARHRSEITAQSITTSDTVLPPAFSLTKRPCALHFDTGYRLDDIHRALSVGLSNESPVVCINLAISDFAERTNMRHALHTRSMLVDMIAK